MDKVIRIGTRDSNLALWQAEEVNKRLSSEGQRSVISCIKTDGDIDLVTPLYETGIQGIFTKALDTALLENKIDVAVHSYKDVPTVLAKGLRIAAVLKRGNPFDVLVCKSEAELREVQSGIPLTIATSSIRRKAQWLYRYNNSQIENIRGNVHTRLQKLHSSEWHGAIFAAAGLERLGINENESGPLLQLDWMLPAPAQGAVVIICRENDSDIISVCSRLNDKVTQLCTQVERDFLSLLQGGCSTPISALATMDEHDIYFRGNITARDGSKAVSVSIRNKKENVSAIAQKAVNEIQKKSPSNILMI